MSARRVALVAAALALLAGLAWLWNATGGGRAGPRLGREEGGAARPSPAELVAPGEVEDDARAELRGRDDAAAARSGAAGDASSFPPTNDEPESGPPESVLLRVRDRASGRELAPALVVVLEERLDPRVVRPGAAGERAEDLGPSPVLLEAPRPGQSWTVFARSPGYGWGRAALEATSEALDIELDPGGDLRVLVSGGPRDPGTKVRVFGASASPLAWSELHSADELEIVGLPEGPVEVAAQIGEVERARELARSATEIVAGTTATVALALEPVEPARWVPLSGSLVVPPEWGLDDFVLSFELQGPALERWTGRPVVSRVEMTLADPQDGLYLWDARDVQPGTYVAVLAALGFERTLEVGPQGARDVALRVGPPCDVRLRCVDAASGEPSRAAVSWSSVAASEPHARVSVPRDAWNAERGRWEFRAPQGPLEVSVAHHALESAVFEVRPGVNELEMELGAAFTMGLRVRLVGLGAERVPGLPTLEPLDGNAAESRWSIELVDPGGWSHPIRFELVLRAEHPGRHRMRMPEMPGFEPVPERVVEIARDAVTEVVVELVRRP